MFIVNNSLTALGRSSELLTKTAHFACFSWPSQGLNSSPLNKYLRLLCNDLRYRVVHSHLVLQETRSPVATHTILTFTDHLNWSKRLPSTLTNWLTFRKDRTRSLTKARKPPNVRTYFVPLITESQVPLRHSVCSLQ